LPTATTLNGNAQLADVLKATDWGYAAAAAPDIFDVWWRRTGFGNTYDLIAQRALSR